MSRVVRRAQGIQRPDHATVAVVGVLEADRAGDRLMKVVARTERGLDLVEAS